jgi:hypothetical protein
LLYLAFVAFLGVFSFILSKTKFNDDNGTHLDSENIINQWKKHVMDQDLYGEKFLRFFLMLILLAGSLLKVLYSTYGLAGLPMLLIRGRRSLEDEGKALSRSIKGVREQLRHIQEKYQRTHKQVSYKDQQALKRLKK